MQRISAKSPGTRHLGHLCNLISRLSSLKCLLRNQMIELFLKPSDRTKRIIGGKQIVLTRLTDQRIEVTQKFQRSLIIFTVCPDFCQFFQITFHKKSPFWALTLWNYMVRRKVISFFCISDKCYDLHLQLFKTNCFFLFLCFGILSG